MKNPRQINDDQRPEGVCLAPLESKTPQSMEGEEADTTPYHSQPLCVVG
jgi:hypothetical protein